MPEDGADVIAPPPRLYLAALICGLMLDAMLEYAGFPRLQSALVPGVLFLLCGVALITWSFSRMRRAGTSGVPGAEAHALVTDGPFRFSRNPVYLGMSLAYCGLAIAGGSMGALALLPLLLGVMQHGVILREERYLARRFGDAWQAYCDRTRRWF